jgi:hypothetical protein
MTTWTWIRYSYAWDVTPKHFHPGVPVVEPSPNVRPWIAERFVRLQGIVVGFGHQSYTDAWRGYLRESSQGGPRYQHGVATVILAAEHPRPRSGMALQISGRVHAKPTFYSFRRLGSTHRIYLDAGASRFHGASVAGLVIGTMGVFIFGLYLRSWLRATKALACEPARDMIV